jgi:pimeloyl-ACP methyl ester carboxylesterase
MGAALGTASQASLLLLVRAIILPLLWSARFWKQGVGAAYADAARLAPPMLTRYRWPAQVAGADRGVACFVLSALLGARQLRTADLTSVGAPEARDAEARAAAALAMTDAQLVRALREAEVPVLIVHGTDDRLVPLSNSRRLAQQLGPLATLVELPGCGHCPQEEDPERVAEEVSAFLKARQVLE